MYAPNVHDIDFFKILTIHINMLELENINMGGDFNSISLIY